MDKTRRTRFNTQNDNGLQNTLYQNTSSYSNDRAEFKEIRNSDFKRNDRGNRNHVKRKHYREDYRRNRVFVETVFNPKSKRKNASNFQSSSFKSLPQTKEIPPNKSVKGTEVFAAGRLYVQSRSLASVSTCTNKKQPSQVLDSQLQRCFIPNDLPTNGLSQRSISILKNYKLDRKYISGRGDESSGIFGRFSFRPPRQVSSSKAGRVCSRPVITPGLENKSRQVYHQSDEESRILGDCLRYSDEFENPSQGQSCRSAIGSQEDFEGTSLELDSRNVFTRKATIRFRSSSSGPPFLQATSKSKPDSRGGQAKENFSFTSTSGKRMCLVAESSREFKSNNPQGAKCIFDNRRFRYRVGHTNRSVPLVRQEVFNSDEVAHKSEGIICNLHSPQEVQSVNREQSGNGSGGQSDGDCISAQSRRHKVTDFVPVSEEDLTFRKPVRHHSNPLLHTWKIQHDSRSIVETVSSNRLAFEQESDTEGLQPLGNSRSRPVCDVAVQSSSPVRVDRCDGDGGMLHQCIQPKVGIQFSLGIPTTTINSQSYPTPELCKRNVSGGSPEMDAGFLANSSEIQGHCRAYSCEEPVSSLDRSGHELSASGSVVDDFGGMANTGWNRLIKDLPGEDVELLKSAWRVSTWKTYSSAWKDWTKWCRNEGVVANNPSPQQVAKYLGFLYRIKKVAYSTILVRKSVIATFANPEAEHNVCTHPIVTSMLKAISLKSAEKSSMRPRVWNIQDLITWLKGNPPNESSIYQISRYCTLLLLLASGRRIHDLTLLRVDDKHCSMQSDTITFWPAFGSKTDRAKERQSGWLIKKSQDSEFDIVRWIRQLIHVSSERRKASPGLVNLFITTRGKVKPASRTVIAGWIKPVFLSLGLEVAPGSIRSAVASYNFENNLPLDDLLKRGNWRGATNFFKYYYKSVSAPSLHSNNALLSSFVPI